MADTPEAPPGGLATALRHALRDAAGRAMLRVEAGPPHRARVVRALLQQGALAAGGQVMDGRGGDLLLLGAEARRAARLAGLLDRMAGPGATLVWSLEQDRDAVLAYAASGAVAAPRPPPEGPTLAGLDAALEALPLGGVIRRLVGLRDGPAGTRPDFIRLEPDREALAAAMGPLGGDADLLDHAAQRVAARLRAALAEPAEARILLGSVRAPRLHLPLAEARLPGGGHPPGLLVATLPLSAAAEPEALAARREALAAAGIGLELEGLEAGLLGLLDPAGLPPVHLRLAWSPGLPEAACARLDPARVALSGADTAEARGFAAAFGFAVEAPA
ncbi:hypothetical protein [Falsiroseomonas sp. HW251]|uniref:hypothetical protein n=1 Tax=Falsiroseomonas sp. HW251 TaxID=3390998 RepID=UPI003D314360